jgi:transketolase
MAAVCGGIALHGGLIPYAGTFFTFADYMRPSIRLAAIMGLRVIYVFTHDSIGVGEDGPTHQPVEHLMSLRAMPNVTVIRPADAAETLEAWRAALLNSSGPTALVLSRQNLPRMDRSEFPSAAGLHKGAYTLWQAREGEPDAIIIATGSEVEIALEAARALAEEGINARAVSMPSWELFDAQTPEYKERALPDAVRARVAVEAGVSTGWERYVGLDGEIVGMTGFGASGPASALFKKFGFVSGAVADAARRVVAKQKNNKGGAAS